MCICIVCACAHTVYIYICVCVFVCLCLCLSYSSETSALHPLFSPLSELMSSSSREKSKICTISNNNYNNSNYNYTNNSSYITCTSVARSDLGVLQDVVGLRALRDDTDTLLHVVPKQYLRHRVREFTFTSPGWPSFSVY